MIEEISITIAFTSGFLSFFAPCILPLIPPYLAWLSGISLKEDLDKGKVRAKLFVYSVFFVLGFTIIFTILGASASLISKVLIPYRLWVQRIGGLIIFLFGLDFIGFLKEFKNYRIGFVEKLFSKLNYKTHSLLVGLTFAFAWVACFSPILGSILILSSFQGTLSQGVVLLSFYSLGLAVPFLITSLFLGELIGKIESLTKITKWINLFSGLILIILGIMLFTDTFYKAVAILTQLLL